MTIPEIVEKYTIRTNPNKNLCVRREILKHEDDKAYIKEHRDEIIAYIEEQKAIEAVKAGEAECLEKDGVIVYKPKADVNVRIDIKNKQ